VTSNPTSTISGSSSRRPGDDVPDEYWGEGGWIGRSHMETILARRWVEGEIGAFELTRIKKQREEQNKIGRSGRRMRRRGKKRRMRRERDCHISEPSSTPASIETPVSTTDTASTPPLLLPLPQLQLPKVIHLPSPFSSSSSTCPYTPRLSVLVPGKISS